MPKARHLITAISVVAVAAALFFGAVLYPIYFGETPIGMRPSDNPLKGQPGS